MQLPIQFSQYLIYIYIYAFNLHLIKNNDVQIGI
jgi:hypothetical protein